MRLALASLLLADAFTPTHMTGPVQLKAEWLDEVRSGLMRYHSIQDVQVDLEAGDTGIILAARTLTVTTIWGSRHTWRLRLRIELERDGAGALIAQRTLASIW